MYQADEKRYETMKYHRCGASGLMLPELSLGLWHNFGDTGVYENMKQMCFTAFDNGITHFDLANSFIIPCPCVIFRLSVLLNVLVVIQFSLVYILNSRNFFLIL